MLCHNTTTELRIQNYPVKSWTLALQTWLAEAHVHRFSGRMVVLSLVGPLPQATIVFAAFYGDREL